MMQAFASKASSNRRGADTSGCQFLGFVVGNL
jgi:hypothetical protein